MNAKSAIGFTIIELLVASAVLCVMVVILLGIINQAVNLSQISRAETDRLEKAGSALNLLSNDASVALSPVSPNPTKGLQFVLNKSTSALQEAANSHYAFWQVPTTGENSKGDVSIVGYFIRWDHAGTNPRSQLCRLSILPDDGSANQIYATSNWLSDEILNQAAAAEAPDYQGLVAEDIVGMLMRARDSNGNLFYEWDSRLKGGELPESLDVALFALDSQTAKKLDQEIKVKVSSPQNFESDITQFIADLPPNIQKGVKVFRTTLQIGKAAYTK